MATITSQEVVSFISWLILLIQAGLNLRQALDYYVANESGALVGIVRGGLERVQTGESSLEEAIGTIAADIRRDDLKNVFGLILQANKQGTPISEALSSFFERYQAELMATAEQHGAAANEKATFLLTFEVFLLMGLFLIGMIQSMASGSLF
jgi:type II secretory pathway component PulF